MCFNVDLALTFWICILFFAAKPTLSLIPDLWKAVMDDVPEKIIKCNIKLNSMVWNIWNEKHTIELFVWHYVALVIILLKPTLHVLLSVYYRMKCINDFLYVEIIII